MRALDALGFVLLVAVPGLAGAQQRGGEPAELDPNAPADPRAPADPAEVAERGLPGMGLSISGVTERDGVLSVRGADALKAGEGSLAVFGGRLNIAGGEGRAPTRLHGHIQVADGGRLLATSDFNVDGVLDPRADARAQRVGSPTGVIIVDADLQIVNASRLIVTDSTLSVSGGSILTYDRGGIGSLGRGSSAVFSGESAMLLGGGSALLVVDGGSLQFGDSSTLVVEGSSLSIEGGSLTTSDEARFEVANGNIRIIGAIHHDSLSPISYRNSTVTVTGGSFTVHDRSTVTFTESQLVLRNARLDTNFAVLLDAGAASMRGSSLNVGDGGSIVISEDTAFEARNSTLNVTGGDFEMADLSRLDAACAGDVKIASAHGKATATCIRDALNDDEADQCAGGFFDPQSRRWKCEDTCVAVADERGRRRQICGRTDHF